MRNGGLGAGSRDDGGLAELECKEIDGWNDLEREEFVVVTRRVFCRRGARPRAVQRSMMRVSSMRGKCGSNGRKGMNLKVEVKSKEDLNLPNRDDFGFDLSYRQTPLPSKSDIRFNQARAAVSVNHTS
jgi:hypothetical protein